MIIAIDGPSGSGKSTLARQLAEILGFYFIDSGAIYRSIAYLMHSKGVDFPELEKNFSYKCEKVGGIYHFYINGEDVSSQIREPEISEYASKIAKNPHIRKLTGKIQRELASGNDVVAEGRDLTTHVFKDAELKFFLTADLSVRAKRRYLELLKKDSSISLAVVTEAMIERDKRDETRVHNPLKVAQCAEIIDTSDLSQKQVLKLLVKKGKKEKSALHRQVVWTQFVKFIVRMLFRIFYRIKLVGSTKFPKGRLIIAANHVSYLDPPLLGSHFRDKIKCVGKKSLFKNRFFGGLLSSIGTVPVPETNSSAAKTFKMLLSFLARGEKVLIFPEGGRSIDGELALLKRGASLISLRSKSSILPIHIDGAFEAWPIKARIPKLFKRITIYIGDIVDVERFSHLSEKEYQKQLTEHLQQVMQKMADDAKIYKGDKNGKRD